jgi:hypothetical protein
MTENLFTRDQVVELLQVAATYDRRTIGDTDVVAWAHAAKQGRWAVRVERDGQMAVSTHLAVEAIRHHYATSTAYLMPGHITAYIRAKARQPAPFIALPPAQPASEDRINAVISAVARRLAWPHTPAAPTEDAALAVECPHCHAAPRQPCGRTVTRGPRAGERVLNSQPHPSRVELAGGEHQEAS